MATAQRYTLPELLVTLEDYDSKCKEERERAITCRAAKLAQKPLKKLSSEERKELLQEHGQLTIDKLRVGVANLKKKLRASGVDPKSRETIKTRIKAGQENYDTAKRRQEEDLKKLERPLSKTTRAVLEQVASTGNWDRFHYPEHRDADKLLQLFYPIAEHLCYADRHRGPEGPRLEYTLWQVVVARLKEEFQEKIDGFDGRLGRYLHSVRYKGHRQPDAFTTEIARLDGKGLTDELLRMIWDEWLSEAKQVPLRNPVAEEEKQPTKTDVPLALDEEELLILNELNQKAPRLLSTYDLEQACPITRKTAGKRLLRMIDLGLVDRPKGSLGGATITGQGKNVLSP